MNKAGQILPAALLLIYLSACGGSNTDSETSRNNPKISSNLNQIEFVIINGRTLFSENSGTLSESGFSDWQQLIDKLPDHNKIDKISLTGHSSNSGSTGENLALSLHRAQYLQALTSDQFPDIPLTVTGRGNTSPLTINETNMDNRVEIRVEAYVSASELN